ncbi:MAG: hypothetical protein ALAOOOJD_00875 [bacterium]|nr:hypothetical protein [bacterium]
MLPWVAYAVLWLLHEVISPQVSFDDALVTALVWILLFAAVSLTLSRIGAGRFALLEEAGRDAIAQNQNEQAENVLARIQTLFAGGLLTKNFQQKAKPRLLRQYFSFHAANLRKEQNRVQVREAWREGIRAEESYDLLKNFVLQQPALTLPTIDLAEELLDRQPDDHELLSFLTRQYLREHRTHFRAEHIFRQYLSRNGPLVPEIIALCLDRLLSHAGGPRLDDFAAWCYVRAFQHGEEKNVALRQALHALRQHLQRVGRQDALAKVVTTIVADFTPEEISGWAIERQERQAQSLAFRMKRVFFELQQRLLELYSRLREHKRSVAMTAGGLLILWLGYFVLSDSGSESKRVANSAPPVDTTKVYALQVSALKSAKTAQQVAEQLRRSGLIEVEVLKPQPLYRVRVGKYRGAQAAQRMADSLKTVGIIRRDSFVTEYGKQ